MAASPKMIEKMEKGAPVVTIFGMNKNPMSK